jgi:hypothetical protein
MFNCEVPKGIQTRLPSSLLLRFIRETTDYAMKRGCKTVRTAMKSDGVLTFSCEIGMLNIPGWDTSQKNAKDVTDAFLVFEQVTRIAVDGFISGWLIAAGVQP